MAKESNKEVFMDGLRKLLKEEWQADICLKGGDSSDESSSISAHKLVLASKSEVFKKMLEPDDVKTPSKKVEIVTLSEMKQEELESLVEFLYSDGSLLSVKGKQHVRSLYLAADKYEIPHLRDLCRTELITLINSENALDYLELTQIPFDQVLNDAAIGHIKCAIYKIVRSDKFKIFVASNPNLAVEIMKASVTPPTGSGYCNRCGRYNSYCYNCKT